MVIHYYGNYFSRPVRLYYLKKNLNTMFSFRIQNGMSVNVTIENKLKPFKKHNEKYS